jgi:hypothetical protein
MNATGAASMRGHGVAATNTARLRMTSPDKNHATKATNRVMGKKTSAYPQWRWHLDEVFVKDNGKLRQARQCRFNASTMEAAGGQSFADLVRPCFETPPREHTRPSVRNQACRSVYNRG